MSSRNGVPTPPILLSEEGPSQDELICPLCCEIPMEPVVTPCHHIFCRSCIDQALVHRSECPNDRHRLTRKDLKPIHGILRRIWERIPVRCPKSQCTWTGSVGSYPAHSRRCGGSGASVAAEYHENLIQAKDRLIEEKNKEIKERDAEILYLQLSVRTLMLAKKRLREELSALSSRQGTIDANAAPNQELTCKPLDVSYSYDRSRVVELTQLICQNLGNKPVKVNIGRLFNCVKNIYDDLARGHNNNPPNYYADVRMLLGACRASPLFTANQQGNFKRWCTEERW